MGKTAKGKGPSNKTLFRKKRKVYDEKTLGIPALNTVGVPAKVKKKGKKGKIFVEDKVCNLFLETL